MAATKGCLNAQWQTTDFMRKPLNFVIASVLRQVPKRTVLPYSPAALPIT